MKMILEDLINHTITSIEKAYKNIGKLSSDIFHIHGMSGNKTRLLYNNICEIPNANYLEVGTWKGSSFISALYKNPSLNGFCIDNFSEFSGSEPIEQILKSNCELFLKENKYKIINKDCWSVTNQDIPSNIDIFMYDGAHNYEEQKKAITYFYPFFSKYFIIMVDDWTCDWVDVKRGTLDGINQMKLRVHYQEEIGLVNTKNYHVGGDTFWNGCGIFVCEKIDN